MTTEELKKLNKDAIAVEGRYEIALIQSAMGAIEPKEVDNYKSYVNAYITAIDSQREYFNCTYKEVRDALFRDMKKKNLKVAGFAHRIGDDGHTAFYAAGLYNLEKAKEWGMTDLKTAQSGYGVIIAIVPQPIEKPTRIIESRVYDDVINLFDAKEQFGIKPLAVRNYKNFKEYDGKYDEILWNIVQTNLAKENMDDLFDVIEKNFDNGVEGVEIMQKVIKDVNKDIKKDEKVEEPKQYQSTLHVLDKVYVRPYTSIGRENEAREGKPKNTDIEK